MIVSRTEFTAVAMKAAMGAGRPWGLAQDASLAVVLLEGMELPGAQALSELLTLTDRVDCAALAPEDTGGSVWSGKAGLCPLLTGCFIRDSGWLQDGLELKDVFSPLLLVPFAAAVCGEVEASWEECRVRLALDAVPDVEGRCAAAKAERMRISVAGTAPAASGSDASRAGAIDISDEIWKTLGAFAHRTLVPASETSRLKGAGAGLTDND
jgi:hypothetical protein